MLKILNLFLIVNTFWSFVYITLFSTGLVNTIFSKKKNLLVVLMSIELMLLGVGFGFAGHSAELLDFKGQVFSLVLLLMSAAESAIGLGLIVAAFRVKGNIDMCEFNQLKN